MQRDDDGVFGHSFYIIDRKTFSAPGSQFLPWLPLVLIAVVLAGVG